MAGENYKPSVIEGPGIGLLPLCVWLKELLQMMVGGTLLA